MLGFEVVFEAFSWVFYRFWLLFGSFFDVFGGFGPFSRVFFGLFWPYFWAPRRVQKGGPKRAKSQWEPLGRSSRGLSSHLACFWGVKKRFKHGCSGAKRLRGSKTQSKRVLGVKTRVFWGKNRPSEGRKEGQNGGQNEVFFGLFLGSTGENVGFLGRFYRFLTSFYRFLRSFYRF